VTDRFEEAAGFAAIRPECRAEFARGRVAGEAPVVAVEATVVAVLEGSLTAQIGESTHRVPAGSMALVDSGTAFAAAGDGARLTLAFSEQMLAGSAARLGFEWSGPVVFSRSLAAVGEALGLVLRRIALELERPSAGGADALDLALSLAALDIVGAHATSDRIARRERSRAGLVDRRLRRSIEFMRDNFDRELALGEIAEAAYLSEFHFARLFKRITGVTPHAYLAGLRIVHARRLLATTDLSIAEVGARVGYQSASHFGKVFRQATAFTPTDYRDAARRG